jgi:hypothetical protein
VHHTWGVSVILGSALTGLPAHYLDVFLDQPTRLCHPGDSPKPSASWADYQGVIWRDRNTERGQKWEMPIDQLYDELQRRSFPAPIFIHEVPRCEVNGHSLCWIEFRRERILGGRKRGQGLSYGFDIEFRVPV